MIEPNIYCKVSGMVMQAIAEHGKGSSPLPLAVEIGCADGQGTMRFAGFCRRVICIDPMVSSRPDIDSRTKHELVVDESKLWMFEGRTREFPVELIKGCSLWPETIAEFSRRLGDEKVDVLIIDGCHHPFEAVWGDFETYYPFVRPGGYVVFDDLYEDCIVRAFDKAQKEMSMRSVDRWSIRSQDILQDCGLLQKVI